MKEVDGRGKRGREEGGVGGMREGGWRREEGR